MLFASIGLGFSIPVTRIPENHTNSYDVKLLKSQKEFRFAFSLDSIFGFVRKNFKFLATILFVISIPHCGYSQENSIKKKLQFSIGYGPAYIDYAKDYTDDQPDFSFNAIGTLIDMNIDWSLLKNRYIGIGFSKQIHSGTINDATANRNRQTGIVFEDYRYTHLKNFYDIHFKKKFKNNIELGVGAFFYQDYFNSFGYDYPEGQVPNYKLSNERESDSFGIFVSPTYLFKINDHVDLGLKGRLGLSFNGFEHIALLPALNVRL